MVAHSEANRSRELINGRARSTRHSSICGVICSDATGDFVNLRLVELMRPYMQDMDRGLAHYFLPSGGRCL
eukprot:scaffold556057_cov52-Prasinocladus_malaysianus.AAC.1